MIHTVIQDSCAILRTELCKDRNQNRLDHLTRLNLGSPTTMEGGNRVITSVRVFVQLSAKYLMNPSADFN